MSLSKKYYFNSLRPFFLGLSATLLVLGASFLHGQEGNLSDSPSIATVTIDAQAPGLALSPDMYGIFFEEINHAGDGGIYAEMIRNRSFEDHRAPEGMRLEENKAVGPNRGWQVAFNTQDQFPCWKLVAMAAEATLTHDTSDPLHPNNPSSALVTIKGLAPNVSAVNLENEGFWGVTVEKDADYLLTFYAKTDGGIDHLDVIIPKQEGDELASAKVSGLTKQWKKFEVPLKANDSYVQGRLVLQFHQTGKIWLDEVSLFPKATWLNRPNGLRRDLVQKLVDLKPAFLRFPGGCIVEGCTLANGYYPTTTLGPTHERPSRWNLWGYRMTQGLGLHEYLQLAEDLGASSMLVISCGMACDFRDGGNTPLDELQPWLDEAMNAIEYAIGSTDTKYGAMRAAAGHPEPFNLKFVEIGNENWNSNDYRPRYEYFHKKLQEKYPQLLYITNIEIGGNPNEIRDDHYYQNPTWFRAEEHHYDKEPRTGRTVYVGEYASNQESGHGNLRGALAEAAFLIGLERNADLVTMTSYAPLFVNIHDRGWVVNLIGFDQYRSFGIPMYHVQKMFAHENGDLVLPSSLEWTQIPQNQTAENQPPALKPMTALAMRDSKTGDIVLKVVNFSEKPETLTLQLNGMESLGPQIKKVVLTSESDVDENTVDEPEKVLPKESSLDLAQCRISQTPQDQDPLQNGHAEKSTSIQLKLDPISLTIFRFHAQ